MAISGFNAELGRQQFLELLVTQLQHQDPLEPVGQQEFLQQLAQFSVVEGIESLNLRFEDSLKLQLLNQGASLVGKEVEYTSAATGLTGSGRVDEARIVNGQLFLSVAGTNVPLSDVAAVLSTAE